MKTILFVLFVDSRNSGKDKIQIKEGQDVASSIKSKYRKIFGDGAKITYQESDGIVCIDHEQDNDKVEK